MKNAFEAARVVMTPAVADAGMPVTLLWVSCNELARVGEIDGLGFERCRSLRCSKSSRRELPLPLPTYRMSPKSTFAKIDVVANHADDGCRVVVERNEDVVVAVRPRCREVLQRDVVESRIVGCDERRGRARSPDRRCRLAIVFSVVASGGTPAMRS